MDLRSFSRQYWTLTFCGGGASNLSLCSNLFCWPVLYLLVRMEVETASAESADGGFPVLQWQEMFLETPVLFHVIFMENTVFAWMGSSKAELSNLHVSFPATNQNWVRSCGIKIGFFSSHVSLKGRIASGDDFDRLSRREPRPRNRRQIKHVKEHNFMFTLVHSGES